MPSTYKLTSFYFHPIWFVQCQMLSLEVKVKYEFKIMFISVQIDVFILCIHFYYKITLPRTLPYEECFHSTQSIICEDCIVTK